MPPPEKLKRKVLTLDADADGDGRTDSVTLYARSTILRNGGGIKNLVLRIPY